MVANAEQRVFGLYFLTAFAVCTAVSYSIHLFYGWTID